MISNDVLERAKQVSDELFLISECDFDSEDAPEYPEYAEAILSWMIGRFRSRVLAVRAELDSQVIAQLQRAIECSEGEAVSFEQVVEVCNKKLGSLDINGYGLAYLETDKLVALINEFAVVTQSHTSTLEECTRLRRHVSELELELRSMADKLRKGEPSNG